MSTKPLRILVSGDVEGRLSQLYSRISVIQKKSGAFDLLFCVGNFFGENNEDFEQYVNGKLKAPIATFILGPNKPEHLKNYTDINGCELCENITYLGKKGVFTGSSGLQVAYLSGVEGVGDVTNKTQFNSKDISALKVPHMSDSKFQGVDILLTSPWPKDVEKYGQPPEGSVSPEDSSGIIAALAKDLKPRYHFSGLNGVYYERQPYRNHKVLADAARHVTRFLGLAKVGNKEKKKYLYAFSIVPLHNMDQTELTKQPPDVTECPYTKETTKVVKPVQETEESSGPQFFYDMKSSEKSNQNRKRGGDGRGGPDEKKQRKPPQPTGPCWFCLGSPEVEKHLVISVGTETYLALAKGPLVPDHVLILPIGHYQSSVTATDEVRNEVEKYKSSLKKFYKSKGKVPVFFERNFRTQHLQIQVVPVERDMVPDLKEAFTDCAECQNLELHEIPQHSDIKQIVPVGAPYFYAELPGDKLLHRVKKFFPLQFGREALTGPNILNMPDRVDWKNCKYTKEEEIKMVEDFREDFKKYDFNEF